MIEINGIKQRDRERQIAFFTIDGQEFSCGNVPTTLTKTEDIQVYLDSRADEFRLLILRKSYPKSDHKRFQKDSKTEFESMQEWITKGHRNKIQIGLALSGKPKYDYETIEKQELEYKHPKSVRLMALIENSHLTLELKDLLKKIIE